MELDTIHALNKMRSLNTPLKKVYKSYVKHMINPSNISQNDYQKKNHFNKEK